MLAIFLFVAVVVVGRVQTGLIQAREHEREALHLYELSTALIGVYTREAMAKVIAVQVQQVFQATLAQVSFLPDQLTEGVTISVPQQTTVKTPPDRLIPIFSDAHGLLGEIRRGRSAFSPASSPANEHLLQSFFANGPGQAAFGRPKSASRRCGIELICKHNRNQLRCLKAASCAAQWSTRCANLIRANKSRTR